MNTESSWRKILPIALSLFELLFWERIFHTHTNATLHFSKQLVLQNGLDLNKNGFVYLNEKWTLSLPGQTDWQFSFFVEVLLREHNFGHTHMQKHPSTYIKIYLCARGLLCVCVWSKLRSFNSDSSRKRRICNSFSQKDSVFIFNSSIQNHFCWIVKTKTKIVLYT